MAKAKKKSRIHLARQRQRRYRKFLGKARVSVKDLPEIDYKDVATLQKFVSPQGKLYSRKRSGFTAQHQAELKRAVKAARYLGLMPYVG